MWGTLQRDDAGVQGRKSMHSGFANPAPPPMPGAKKAPSAEKPTTQEPTATEPEFVLAPVDDYDPTAHPCGSGASP
jgi:hypothetical protein